MFTVWLCEKETENKMEFEAKGLTSKVGRKMRKYGFAEAKREKWLKIAVYGLCIST